MTELLLLRGALCFGREPGFAGFAVVGSRDVVVAKFLDRIDEFFVDLPSDVGGRFLPDGQLLLVGGQHVGRYWGRVVAWENRRKTGLQPKEIRLLDRVELMVVALRAAERQAQKR